MTFVDQPVFLVGAERSGTTLLRLMLDHHPRIACNLESEYMVSQISEDGAFPEIGAYREWLRGDRGFPHSRFRIDENLGFVELLNDFLNQKRDRDGKDIVGATVHYQFRKLARIWPRARYIYLYRDGRDVAKSVVQMGWAGNVYVAADRWLEAEKEWDQVRERLPDNAWMEVRYEELVANTGPELARICAFVGVEYSERMFDYVGRSTYAAPDARLIYQWKSGMRKADVQRLEAKLGDRLLQRGYEPSTYPRIDVSEPVRRSLYLHSRWHAFLFRLRRYGVTLTLKETLSRRMGFHRIHRDAQRRVNQIADANLK